MRYGSAQTAGHNSFTHLLAPRFRVFAPQRWSPAVVALFEECAAERQNKLRKDEYDTTTWSAHTWLIFKTQKVSVATLVIALVTKVPPPGIFSRKL